MSLEKLMKAWQDFLDSLSTKGGNILLMFMALIGLMAFVHHIGTDNHVDKSILSASHDMMVGFGAALLAVLSGSSSKQQMVDRVAIAKGNVDTPSPDTTTVQTTAAMTLKTEAAPKAPDPTPAVQESKSKPSPWAKK